MRLGGRLLVAELVAKPCERAVERDLDRVRSLIEELGDLADLEVCAVAKGDQLTIASFQLRHGSAQLEFAKRGLLVACLRTLRHVDDRLLP